jgi:hypothetical protein
MGTRTGRHHCATFSPAMNWAAGGRASFSEGGCSACRCRRPACKETACAPSEQHAPRLVRGVSVQIAGGPRLKGSPGEEADRTAFWKTAAIVAAPGESSSACCSGGRQRPCTPQRSQWPEASEVSPVSRPVSPTEPALAMEDATLQRPPSLPVRISSVSMVTGASSAEKTARKPSHAARRTHSGRMNGRDEAIDTGQL